MAQQTAVEWLQIKMATSSPQEMVENINVWFKEAKQMEKERHDKWNEFLNVEKTLGNSDVKTIERIQWYYNQYFKETYEK